MSFRIISTPGLGVGVLCVDCDGKGEQADLTSGVFKDEYSLFDINLMVSRHLFDHHDPVCNYRGDGLRCGYVRSLHPRIIGPSGPHEFVGNRP